jgi:hypothetical protein
VNLNNNQFIESILIESDHDISRSSSDEEFIVSSDEESSSTTDNETTDDRVSEFPISRPKKSLQQLPSKPTKSLVSHSIPPAPGPASSTLSSLSKLLLLNGTPIPSLTLTSNKSPLIPIQPKPNSGTDIYQVNPIRTHHTISFHLFYFRCVIFVNVMFIKKIFFCILMKNIVIHHLNQ